MEYLPPYFVGLATFLFGLLIGSFLNVVIYRLPLRKSIVFPGSHCTSCNAEIRWFDNIPVISYAILLRGRCRRCRTPISIIYPAVELLVAILYLALFLIHKDEIAGGTWLPLIADIVFVSLIVPLVFIDLHHKLLPNRITYPGLLFCFCCEQPFPIRGLCCTRLAFLGLARRLCGPDRWVEQCLAP